MDFAVQADHRTKIKVSEKRDKYSDLAGELKKEWNIRVTVIPMVIGALFNISKGLIKELEELEIGGRAKSIQSWRQRSRATRRLHFQ